METKVKYCGTNDPEVINALLEKRGVDASAVINIVHLENSIIRIYYKDKE